jgi:glycosyltransferase involved in cell wall biosynthesis
MKVIFDCRYTRLVRHDGISRYTAGLVAAFAKLHPVTMLIHDERQLTMLPDLPWIKSRPGTSLLEPFMPMLALNREKPDVVFSPMQMIGSVGRRFKLILTVHDLVFYRTRTPPKEFGWAIRAGWWAFHLCYWPQRLTLNRADAIVTGSYNCETEMKAVHLTKRPVAVIRPGVDNIGVTERSYPTEKTLVYMGTFMPNKNVECLARAMHLLPGYTLRLLSRISDETRLRIAALAPEGSIVFDNGVTDDEYQAALSVATAMVTACRDEGFGIPLIEGEVAGTPLILSDIPLFHEVGGDAAVYFDCESPASFASAVLGMDNPGEWMRLSQRSLDQAERFTWEESAERLLALVNDVTGHVMTKDLVS